MTDAQLLEHRSMELTLRSWRVTRSSSRIASMGNIALLDTFRISSSTITKRISWAAVPKIGELRG